MSRRERNRFQTCAVISTAAFLTFLVLGSAASPAAGEEKRRYSDGELATMPLPGPKPSLSIQPPSAEVDWVYWQQKKDYELRRHLEEKASRGASKNRGGVTEVEPNDTFGTAQLLSGFGTGPGETAAITIAGSFTSPPVPMALAPASEDDGSISFATPVSVGAGESRGTGGTIGDGPHGSGGSGSGDFDFYSLSATAGAEITLLVTTPEPVEGLDPSCALWDSTGALLAFHSDNGPDDFDCQLTTTAPATGTYFYSVSGWRSGGVGAQLPADPFESDSGSGSGSEGPYDVVIGVDIAEHDCFALDLEPGDVVGTAAVGDANQVTFFNSLQELSMGSHFPGGSFVYPAGSPLPLGEITTDFVASQSGLHAVCVRGSAVGSYSLDVEAYRPTLEGTVQHQVIFVDFDGAVVDPAIFGGPPGETAFSPLSAFLANWGLGSGDEDAVIDAILASVVETYSDLATVHPRFAVEILNSRDHADPFGQPNVSRVVVGGTAAELGFLTVGISESIDPGNFLTEETAVVLLDTLSAPPSNPLSLNAFPIAPGHTIVDVIGTGVGNFVAHESGHFLGCWHTEDEDPSSELSIMDQGSSSALRLGVGEDGVFGSEDDIDLDFTTDVFALNLTFALEGLNHTGERTAYGLTGLFADLFADGFESGDLAAWSLVVP